MVDSKLILEKVLKVSCRYLLSFFSYRENPAGGAESAPLQRARVTHENFKADAADLDIHRFCYEWYRWAPNGPNN